MEFEKALMYKTAFSPLFQIFVKIEKVRKNEDLIIFHCSGTYNDGVKFTDHMFTGYELDRFTI